jgi:cysteine-rich repeat protein
VKGITLVVLCLAGCASPAQVECADGSICVAGTECRSASGVTLCVPVDELHDCDGLDLFDECGDGAHRCFESTGGLICWPAGCGNHLLDPGEQCDLGDTIVGDGCSADCRSNEVCGNGVVDPIHFEQCDDGDASTHDGCSSTCVVEQPVWTEPAPPLVAPHEAPGLAYDVRRGRLVLFGGATGAFLPAPGNDTLEWTGSGWVEPSSGIAPAPRIGSAMAYDSSTGETVLFGGGNNADTWQWNGTRWRAVDVFKPPARAYASMAYDARRHAIIMFGGVTADGPSNETWQFANGEWSAVITATSPPAVPRSAMTYDPLRDAIVLVLPDQAWELANGDWRPLPPPPPMTVPTVAFDPITSRIVIVGGAANETMYSMRAFTGTGWTLVAPTPIALGTRGALVGDPVHRRVVFSGVISGGSSTNQARFYEWNGTTWSDPQPAPPPERLPGITNGAGLSGAAMVNDPLHGRVLLFGGRKAGGAAHLPNTWSFDGSNWSVIATAGPNPRFDHAMAYDVERDQLVLFGGVVGSSTTSDTWLFDGITWTIATVLNPPARRQHAMAYDMKRKRVVMFGGSPNGGSLSGCGTCLSDTWEWDGAVWTQITTATTPPALAGARLAYDYSIEKLVMFGGWSGNAAVASTWTYDGIDWHLETLLGSPDPRAYGALVWDSARRHLVYAGGGDAPPLTIQEVVSLEGDWELDMQHGLWRRLAIQDPIATRFRQAAASGVDGSGVISIGGVLDESGVVDSVHPTTVNELVWQSDSREETCVTRVDGDGDGLVNCADTDCWSVCRPLCPPGDDSCLASTPHCGDGVCSTPLERPTNCSDDCGAAPVTCGDLVCDPGEMCPGDCP